MPLYCGLVTFQQAVELVAACACTRRDKGLEPHLDEKLRELYDVYIRIKSEITTLSLDYIEGKEEQTQQIVGYGRILRSYYRIETLCKEIFPQHLVRLRTEFNYLAEFLIAEQLFTAAQIEWTQKISTPSRQLSIRLRNLPSNIMHCDPRALARTVNEAYLALVEMHQMIAEMTMGCPELFKESQSPHVSPIMSRQAPICQNN